MKKTLLLLLSAALLSGCAALHFLPSKQVLAIEFADTPPNAAYAFRFQGLNESPELQTLRERYPLDSVARAGTTEFEHMLHLLQWTHSRWEHSGSNQPSKSSTLTILEEAEAGKKFRCVEYGIVLRSVLASAGYRARTLGLKTRDVEVTRVGAGHVLTEVWSGQYQKWFLLDGQFNLVPVLDGVPLNAVEFQRAIVEGKPFSLVDRDGPADAARRERYLNFIPHYLYYFDAKFDQREVPYDSLLKVNGKTSLMLVPLGAANPVVFQRKQPMTYLEYTHSLRDFYRKP